MKRLVLTSLLAACSSNANIGMSSQPVSCQPTAAGLVQGTVTNATTHKSYSFGSVGATLSSSSQEPSVSLADTSLTLQLAFPCSGPLAVGMYDLALDQQGTCPAFAVGTVSGRLQEVYGQAQSGVLILDQTTDCIAGRYDATVGVALDNGTFANEGEVSGWFSVPL